MKRTYSTIQGRWPSRWAALGLLLSAGCGTSAALPSADVTVETMADAAHDAGEQGGLSQDSAATTDAGPQTGTDACTPPVTWQDQIGPLLDTYCGGACHANGEEWATCAKSQKKATTIKNYLKNNLMPPYGSPTPSDAERQLLYDWVATGKTCTNPCL